MTWLEVVDDAVKIGLGGFIGWFVAKGSRAHELEKERRRRKQDCLERVVEDLDEAEESIEELSAAVRIRCRWRKEDAAAEEQSFAVREVNKRFEVNKAAGTKLYRSRSKLTVFGFGDCCEALEGYDGGVRWYRALLVDVLDGTKKSSDEVSAHGKVRAFGDELRVAVTEAFKAL